MSTIKVTTDATFTEDVVGQSGYVLVDFWATWCGPCKMIAPVLEQIAAESTTVTIAKIDVDDNPQTAAKYGIRSIPTLILFNNGQPVATKVGGLPKQALIDWVNQNSASK